MAWEYSKIEHVSELSPEEKDRLIDLILDRIGCEIVAYKLDGEQRTIEVQGRKVD